MLRRLFKGRKAANHPEPTAAAPAGVPSVSKQVVQAPLLRLPAAEAAIEIRAIADVDKLIDLALQARAELRAAVLAHPLLRQGSGLVALEKRSRDKDKSLNRHARTHLDRYKALLRDANAGRTRAEELAAALARSHPTADDHAARDRQHQLHQRLTVAVDAYQALRREIADFGEVLPDLETLRPDPNDLLPLEDPAAPVEQEHPAEPLRPEPDAVTAEDRGPDLFEPLLPELQALDQALSSDRPLATMAAAHQALAERWLAAAAGPPASAEQQALFERVSQRFQQLSAAVARLAAADLPPLTAAAPVAADAVDDTDPTRWRALDERRRLATRLEKLRRSLDWPEWAKPTAEYVRLLESQAVLRDELSQAQALVDGAVQRLEADVTALAEAIDAGSLSNARQLLIQARARHDALPQAAIQTLGKRLGQQAARLAELRDWQTFATAPKREALVQAMEALAEAPLAPPDQAGRIKQLRAEWQALGPVTQAADGRLADRFNGLAAKAFDSCRAYFAEQAELRRANLAERSSICDQLEHYLEHAEWRHPDVRAAENIMRTARDAWRSFVPVDRSQGKVVEQRFETLQGQLHDRIKAEWDRNVAAKETIVAEAQGLHDADLPVEGKVSAAKNLQQRWRAVGATPRRHDQRLWQAFREACDAVFALREQARHQADTATVALELRCRELLDEFDAMLQQLDPVSAAEGQLREFRNAAAEIDDLPQNQRRDLAARRTDLINRYRNLLDTKATAVHQQQLLGFKHWDEAVTLAEAAGSTAADAAAGADSGPVPAQVQQARAACAGGPVPAEALRRLTVKAELVAGRESPASDEQLRLQVQVERLQAGLAGRDAAEEPQALAQQWCELGPKDAAVAPLRERFFSALTARG